MNGDHNNNNNHHNMSDHRVILQKMNEQERRLGEVLEECRNIRTDMLKTVVDGQKEAREDREKHRTEVASLHSRINDIKILAERTDEKLASQTKELEKVRGNLGKVTTSLVVTVITAVIAAVIKLGGG